MSTLATKHKQGQFTITVELDPPKSASYLHTGEEAAQLAGKIDAINIADCPMARMRMSPIALSHMIQLHYGVETIFHLTCRDRNLIGLQSELLGAAALGVHNILTLTGDQPGQGDHPQAKPVFETDSTGLIRIARTLNSGVDMSGNPLEEPTHFYIGTTANPGNPDIQAEIDKLKGKIEAGANFVQTQPIYDIEIAKRFMDKASALSIPILFGILPLKGFKMASYLHEKVPGITIPAPIMARMEKEGRPAGLDIAANILNELRTFAAGVHIMPLNDISAVLTILEQA